MKLYQSMSVVGGRGYTLSFWARSTVAQELVLHLYSTSCPGIRCLNDTRLQLGTSWQRYEVPFVASGTSSMAGLNLLVSRVGSVWIDDVSLREGDTSVYRRDFDNGIVLLNYTTSPRVVDLGGQFRRLSAPGNTIYDGSTITSETLAPSDGRILLNASTPAPAPPPVPSARLDQNEPNPFNPSTTIRYTVARSEKVHLAVYDIAGRLVRTLWSGPRDAGHHELRWDGRNEAGAPSATGIYFARLTGGDLVQSCKLALVH